MAELTVNARAFCAYSCNHR